MRIKVHLDKNVTNHHGTQMRGEPWNEQMVRGWKICVIDLLKDIRERETVNPEGGKTRARWYKRFILYFPDGSWWNLDVALVKSIS